LVLVLADARAPALLAIAPDALVLADARAPAFLVLAPDALVLADARSLDTTHSLSRERERVPFINEVTPLARFSVGKP